MGRSRKLSKIAPDPVVKDPGVPVLVDLPINNSRVVRGEGKHKRHRVLCSAVAGTVSEVQL